MMANFPYFSSLLKIDEGKSAKYLLKKLLVELTKSYLLAIKILGLIVPLSKALRV